MGQLPPPAVWLAKLEYLFPNLLVLRPLFYLIGSDRIDILRPRFLNRLHFWVRRSTAAFRVSFLSLLAHRPAGEQPRAVRMGSIFEGRRPRNRAYTFRQQITYRSAFFYPRWKMMRIASEASRSLAGHQKLREL